jgi:hypothetical protein
MASWRTETPAGSETMARRKENPMFWMIVALLVFLWLLGLVE